MPGTIRAVLHLHEFGPADGVPVLALHGVIGHGARWRRLAAELPGIRLLGVDLRGHGRSSWTPPWDIDQHVTDALDVLDWLGLDRVAVLGHSYGGAIAVHFARRAPARVSRLAMIDPAIGLDPAEMLDVAEQHRQPAVFPDPATAVADKAESWDGVPIEAVRAEVDEHLVQLGRHGWGWRYCPAAAIVGWSEMARPAVTPPAGIPTLVVVAKRADYVRPSWLAACRVILGDELTVTELDTGHMIYLERPVEVATLVSEFLA